MTVAVQALFQYREKTGCNLNCVIENKQNLMPLLISVFHNLAT